MSVLRNTFCAAIASTSLAACANEHTGPVPQSEPAARGMSIAATPAAAPPEGMFANLTNGLFAPGATTART